MKPTENTKLDYINIATISRDIDNFVNDFFTIRNIDINDIAQCRTIPHNVLTLCLLGIYNNFFKPHKTLVNNQNSLIDYNNIEQLTVIANKFIELSLMFNKSLGLMQFSVMTGIHRSTLAEWRDNEKLNPTRSDLIQNICELHKMEQVNLLNDSPVGALAVANNDKETGLNWSANQAAQITNNTVYLLPSERVDRFRLEDQEKTPT
jgi:hypothetical protein